MTISMIRCLTGTMLSLALYALPSLTFAQGQSLSQLWNQVKTSDAGVRAESERTSGKESAKDASYFGILPSIELNFTSGNYQSEPNNYVNQHVWTLELRQPIFDISQWELIHLSASESELAQATEEKSIYDLRYKLARAFIHSVAKNQVLALYQLIIDRDLKNASENILSVETSGLKGSISSSFELSRISLFYQKAAELSEDKIRYQLSISEMLGQAAPDITGDLLRISLPSSSTVLAKTRNVDDRLADLTVQRNNSLVRLEQYRLVPSIYGFANRTQSWDRAKDLETEKKTYSAGLGLSWTISTGIRGHYSALAASAESRALIIQMENMRKIRTLRLRSLQSMLVSSFANAREARSLADRGVKILLAARDQRNLGLISIPQFYSTVLSAAEVYMSSVDSVARYLLLTIEQQYEAGSFDDKQLILLSNILSHF